MLFLDVCLIVLYLLWYPEFSAHIVRSLSVAGIGVPAIATIAKFLAKKLGWTDNNQIWESGSSSPLHNRFVQIGITAVFILMGLLHVQPTFLMPPVATVILHIKVVPNQPLPLEWSGELVASLGSGVVAQTRQIHNDTVVFFERREKGSQYKFTYFPFDQESYMIDSIRNEVSTDPMHDTLKLYRRHYSVPFVFTPPDAKLTVDHLPRIPTESTSIATGIIDGLLKEEYSYALEAKDTNEYYSIASKFSVPRDTLKLSLSRKHVEVRFVADRGLGFKEILIPAHFKILEGSSVVAYALESGESVRLEVGVGYTVEATAKEDWDLSGRVYVKRENICIPKRGSKEPIERKIKVHEKKPGE
ncbi:MAG: hypothetical protein HY033_05510 [Ignavibacteriae bacterium]|nr:hypothetical protein [Ignavibacteria bacterium]MBI3364346.1 hypothetical protein [Ignavibacteriota bacterium]